MYIFTKCAMLILCLLSFAVAYCSAINAEIACNENKMIGLSLILCTIIFMFVGVSCLFTLRSYC